MNQCTLYPSPSPAPHHPGRTSSCCDSRSSIVCTCRSPLLFQSPPPSQPSSSAAAALPFAACDLVSFCSNTRVLALPGPTPCRQEVALHHHITWGQHMVDSLNYQPRCLNGSHRDSCKSTSALLRSMHNCQANLALHWSKANPSWLARTASLCDILLCTAAPRSMACW
jgi:hypothetical protein